MGGKRTVLVWDPEYCRHCFGCIANCSRQALTLDHDRGTLCYDIRKCIRCNNCIKACYTGALHVEPAVEN